MENSQGNWANPPRSRTIEGTAVARMVESMAISPTLSMMDSRTGPRSDRKPTSALVTSVCVTTGDNPGVTPAIPRRGGGLRPVGWVMWFDYPHRSATEMAWTLCTLDERVLKLG